MTTHSKAVAPDQQVLEDVRQLVRELFADHSRASHGPTQVETRFEPDLWSTLESAGLARITGAERAGGSGATWEEAAVVMFEAAAHAVPVPLLEHDLLAGWLRDTLELPSLSEQFSTAAHVTSPGPTRAPWLSAAHTVVVLDSSGNEALAYELYVTDLQITAGRKPDGTPLDTMAAPRPSISAVSVPLETMEEWAYRGALGRAVQMTGAMDALIRLSVEHARDRTQFGRPLGRFQAVQRLVTDVVCEAVMCRALVNRAVRAATEQGFGHPHTRFLVAAAKASTGYSVELVVRNAHQIHGAIGTTLEHPLQRHTRALLAWRRDHGSTLAWAGRLEATAVGGGGDRLWDLVTR